jgi:hypothetical protein
MHPVPILQGGTNLIAVSTVSPTSAKPIQIDLSVA